MGMVYGSLPFDDKDIGKLHGKIKENKLTCREYVYDKDGYKQPVSSDIRHLIQRLIEKDSNLRFSMKDILNNKWFKQTPSLDVDSSEEIIGVSTSILKSHPLHDNDTKNL